MIIRNVHAGYGPFVEALKKLKQKMEQCEHLKGTWKDYDKHHRRHCRMRDNLRQEVPAHLDPFGKD